MHSDETSIYSIVDDAADTLRMTPAFGGDTDLEVTSVYVRRVDRAVARRRMIRATRQDIVRLRDAIGAGWDVGPELAHEEHQLAMLEAAL